MRGTISKEMFDCIPEIDYNTGYRYFLGNMDNYANALLSILKSVKSKLPLLHLMIVSEEYEGLRTITQTLRKMFRNVGAVEFAESTYRLEMAVLNEDNASIREELQPFIIQLAELAEHIEELLKKVNVRNSEKTEEDQNSFLNYDFTKTKESIKRSSYLLERKII